MADHAIEDFPVGGALGNGIDAFVFGLVAREGIEESQLAFDVHVDADHGGGFVPEVVLEGADVGDGFVEVEVGDVVAAGLPEFEVALVAEDAGGTA